MFQYHTGEAVRVGDTVVYGDRRAIVEVILEPASDEARQWDAPDGGVLIKEEEGSDAVLGRVMLTPPDGEHWEDLDLVRRAKV